MRELRYIQVNNLSGGETEEEDRGTVEGTQEEIGGTRRKVGEAKEQVKKLWEQEKKLEQQEKKLGEQDKKLGEQEKKLGEQEKKLREQDKTSRLEKEFRVELEKKVQELNKTFQDFEQKVSTTIFLHRRFEMRNFSAEKRKDKFNDWKSPAMYTHVGGYKFCVGVDANGYHGGYGKSIYVDLWATSGEFDDQLKWPAKAEFTVELVKQRGGQNVKCSHQTEWVKPTLLEQMVSFRPLEYGFSGSY